MLLPDTEDSDAEDMVALVHDPATRRLSLQRLPLPVAAGAEDHLVQVHAVALTNGELAWPQPASVQPCSIPGYEVSGTVLSAPDASPYQRGTEVYARTDFARQGNAREFAVLHTDELGQKPENLSWEEAATVPLSALTAWQALFDHGGIAEPVVRRRREARTTAATIAAETDLSSNKTKRILITAAAGGVGLWAVQLARLAGVGHITATCGPANVDFVRSLGAHRVIDYTTVVENTGAAISSSSSSSIPSTSTSSPTGSAAKYDLVIDCVGGETLRRAWTRVRHGGTVISLAVPADTMRPDSGVGMDVKSVWFIVRADSTQLQAITHLIEAEAAKAVFDSAYQLDQYEAALAKAHSGHVRGKVVLRLA